MCATYGESQPLVILHLDMDAFFAAIEQRDHPELRGKPVVVGAPPHQRGVVSTCSYEARRYGIRSAMPSRTAYGRCPHAVFLPVRMAAYTEASRRVMQILRGVTPLVEQVSIDEAFLDITPALRSFRDAVEVAGHLKQAIRHDLRLTASVGVAPNKFLAKLASDLEKPDGLTVTPADEPGIRDFLAPLPVSKIWGVGDAAEAQLKRFGIRTIGDLQRRDRDALCRMFGDRMGGHLDCLARGWDTRPIVTEREEKSISNEHTFSEDVTDQAILHETLVRLTEKVGRRLRAAEKEARTGFIKVRFEDFTTLTRQVSFAAPSAQDDVLLRAARELYGRLRVRRPVRLIGVGVSNLSDAHEVPRQLELFADSEHDRDKRSKALDSALDELRTKYGETIIRRGIWR